MPDWNPITADDYGRSFRLVPVTYFPARRAIPGKHFMMQDGDAASFALHIPGDTFLTPDQVLTAAWSSNVRHALVFNPVTKTAIHRRWDNPAFEDQRRLASEDDARAFVRDIESAGFLAEADGVINRTLRTFNLLRTAIEERQGEKIDVAVAFNVALLLAEIWRDTFAEMPSISLADAVVQLHRDHPWLGASSVSRQVRDYDIGEFVQIMLEKKQDGSRYLLDADLLIRHASGLLYQELHTNLVTPVPTFRQRQAFDDSLPSGPTKRRRILPRGSIHHTKPWLARALVEVAIEHVDSQRKDSLVVLDPACGSGVFLIETAREQERTNGPTIRLVGMDKSPPAGVMSSFCVGEASRNLSKVSQAIQGGIDSLTVDWGQPDIVVMNPPYKAWKDLSAKDREIVSSVLGKHKVGKPDLYMAFLAKAAESLSQGGVLAAVFPSAFFTAKSAKKLRDHLYGGTFRVRMVGLFGFEIFDEAQVEAAALVVSKAQVDSRIRVVIAQDGNADKAIRLLRETPLSESAADSGFEIYSIPAAFIKNKSGILHQQADSEFAETLSAKTPTVAEELFTVRLGVRGIGPKGSEKVLLLAEDELSKMAPTEIERRFFRPVADRIEKGRIVPAGFVFYPYGTDGKLLLTKERDFADALPTFYRKLLPLKKPLRERKSHYRNWWEPTRPVATWLAAHYPRIVSQEHGKKGNFAFDEDGHYAVVGGHAWCWNDGSPKPEIMFAYLSLLNSRVVERLFKVYCQALQGGQFKLASRFVHNVPLPDLSRGSPDLTAIGRRIHAGESYDEDALDSAVLAAYGVKQNSLRSVARKVRDLAGNDENEFRLLVEQWKKETSHLSNIASAQIMRPTKRLLQWARLQFRSYLQS